MLPMTDISPSAFMSIGPARSQLSVMVMEPSVPSGTPRLVPVPLQPATRVSAPKPSWNVEPLMAILP